MLSLKLVYYCDLLQTTGTSSRHDALGWFVYGPQLACGYLAGDKSLGVGIAPYRSKSESMGEDSGRYTG